MQKPPVLEIIESCRGLDQIAQETYECFSRNESFDEESRQFWLSVADDEKHHIQFWDRVEKFFLDDENARLFENTHSVLAELKEANSKVSLLQERSHSIQSITEALLVGFSLEIHLLHPVFEVFFQYMREPFKSATPCKSYSNHLSKFFDFASRHGEAVMEIAVFRDIVNRLTTMNKELALCTQLDPMTSVFNRRGLFSNMEILGHLAKRNGHSIGIIMVDIDDFKAVNDRYGHQKGDEVIIGVANILADTVRRSDVVGRLGGEEFLVFLSDTDPGKLLEVAEKMRAAVGGNTEWGVSVTVSVGAAYGTITGDPLGEIEEFLKLADQHLYSAKRDGKNRVSALVP